MPTLAWAWAFRTTSKLNSAAGAKAAFPAAFSFLHHWWISSSESGMQSRLTEHPITIGHASQLHVEVWHQGACLNSLHVPIIAFSAQIAGLADSSVAFCCIRQQPHVVCAFLAAVE
jgi:hypothetical protein